MTSLSRGYIGFANISFDGPHTKDAPEHNTLFLFTASAPGTPQIFQLCLSAISASAWTKMKNPVFAGEIFATGTN